MEPALIPLRRTRLRLSRLGSWPLLAALALPLTAGAMLTPTVSQAAAVDSVPPAAFGTFWYVISVLGNRGGYSRQSLQRLPAGGEAVVESTDFTTLKIQMGAQKLSASRTEIRRYDADLRLVSLEHHSDQFGRKLRLTLTRQGDKFHLRREAPDGTTERDLTTPEDFGLELRALQALGDGEIKPGWKQSFSTFDAELGNVDRVQIEVVGQETVGNQACWRLRTRGELLKVSTDSWATSQGILVRQQVPDLMNLGMELVTEREALKQVAPMLVATSIPVSKNLGEPKSLSRVVLRVRNQTTLPADLFADTPRQQVVADAGALRVTTVAQPSPRQAVTLPVAGPDLAPFLAPSDLCQSQDPAVVAKAREILGGETDSWRAVCRLREWVYKSLRKVSSEPRPISATEVLQQMSGDCTEHATLMAALCQAAGLPVKMAVGVAYMERAYHYHAWNAVYVGEWVEVDATWNEALADAGHLQVGAAALDSASMSRLSLAAGRTMGGLEFEVLDHESRL